MLKNQINEIKQIIAEYIPVMNGLTRARNPFELRYFVIGRHDDRVQQYKQAVVEMDAKYKAVMEALHNKKVSDVEIELIKIEMVEAETKREELENLKRQYEIEKLQRQQQEGLQAVIGACKEILDFIHIIENEYSDLVDKTEDELLKYEVDYWKSRFTKQIHIDLMTLGQISAGNRSTLESMPKELQEEILQNAMMRREEVNRFENLIAQKTMEFICSSNPKPTQYLASGNDLPLKLRKDAPENYPENLIVNIDKAEIMIASLHRPGDKLLSSEFYIPAGKNHVICELECDDPLKIGEYRNKIVKNALSLGCDYIFFIDDDLIINPDALLKLYDHDLDIVGGWYPMKTPVIQSATLIKDGDSKKPVPLNSQGLIEIDWSLAAGLTLIKTSVFKKLNYPWYHTSISGTEDTYFTQMAKSAGIISYLDTDIKAIHVNKEKNLYYSFDGIREGICQ